MRKIVWCHLGLLLLDPAAPSYGRVQVNVKRVPPTSSRPTRHAAERCRHADFASGGTNAANAAGEGRAAARGRQAGSMLDPTKRLVTPSLRSDVPPFMVMDVMAAAARLEAAGRRIIHMEVGQPAAAAPSTARAAAQAALRRRGSATPSRSASRRCARASPRHYRERYGIDVDPGRVVVTTGSSAGFMLAFLAMFEPGDRVAIACPGLSALPPHPHGARLRAGADRDFGAEPLGAHAAGADRRASRAAARRASWSRARPIRPAP